MELTAYEIALIAGGFTVLGALVGSFLTYRFALHLSEIAARRDAGHRLREAFAPELAALDPATTGAKDLHVQRLLQKAWPRHRMAVSELAFHLPTAQQKALEQAWREYCEVGGSIRFYDYEMGDNPRQKFMDRVNAILKFAQV